MNSNKTTKDNPAAFQKVQPITLLMILKKTARKLISYQLKAAINFFKSELLNYFCKYKIKNKFYCNLCKFETPFFLNTANEKKILYNSICPNCSSRKRHRGLYEIYKNILKKTNSPRILHFAPEPVFYNLFKSLQYITADLELTDVDLKLDIEKIDHVSNSFDIILCNHVLEHVSDDNKALKELYRLLAPSGTAIITVPGVWERNDIIKYEKPNGNGHHRDYGLEFINILDQIFNTVKSIDLYQYNNVYKLSIGLTPNHDLVFLCKKD